MKQLDDLKKRYNRYAVKKYYVLFFNASKKSIGVSAGGILKDIIVLPSLFETAKSPRVIISMPIINSKKPLSKNSVPLRFPIITLEGRSISIIYTGYFFALIALSSRW